MNLWVRLAWLLLASLWRDRLSMPDGVSRLRLRVLPNDVDLNMHMNNGRYLTVADLGCIDLIFRSGLRGPVIRNGWLPVIQSSSVVFKRPLKPFQPYVLETRIVRVDERTLDLQARFLVRVGGVEKVAATALVAGGFYAPDRRGYVPVAEVLAAAGVSTESNGSKAEKSPVEGGPELAVAFEP